MKTSSFLRMGVVLSLCWGVLLGAAAQAQTASVGKIVVTQHDPMESLAAGTLAPDFGIGWTPMHWQIGDEKGSDAAWAPEVGLAYFVNDGLEVRLAGKYVSGEDTATEASLGRLNLGARYWIATKSAIMPYVGASLGYYHPDVDWTGHAVSVDDSIGMNLEGGVAFRLADNFALTLGVSYDRLLADAGATVDGNDTDVEMDAVSLNFGAVLLF